MVSRNFCGTPPSIPRQIAEDYMTAETYAHLGNQSPHFFQITEPLDHKDKQIIIRDIGNTAVWSEYRRLSWFARAAIWLDDTIRGTLR